MGVFVMLELDGDSQALLTAAADLEARLSPVDGLLSRSVAPTEEGIVVFTHWESPAARQANTDAPGHAEALEASGLRAAAAGMRSRVFDDAELTVPPATSSA